MAPILDRERYSIIERLVNNDGRQVGFIVKYPWGSTAGYYGQTSKPGREAMSRKAAEALIAAEAAKFDISDEGFTLLPIAARFVK